LRASDAGPRAAALGALGAVLAALLASGCSGATATAPGAASTPRPTGADDRRFSGRQVMVTFAPAPPPLWAQQTRMLEHDFELSTVFAWSLASLGERCVVYEVPPGRSVEGMVERLAAHPQVGSVQPIYEFETLATYNDPYAHLQYGAQALRLEEAHRLATGKGVRVAVVDTGVDVDHPDLRGRIAHVGNFVDRGERSFTSDVHGTAVAGVIAADANNGVGIVGVAPAAEVLALKACWEPSASSRRGVCNSYTLAKAVDFAIAERVQVLNFSLGGPPDPLLRRLFAKAVQRGTIVVAAYADAQGRGFPASLDGVLGVFASDPQGALRGAPQAHLRPALAAPGVDVLSTAPRSSYDFFSGSSLAAAHVSGIVALLLERNPRLTPRDLESLFRGTAHPLPASGGAGTPVGLVDACAALEKVAGVACTGMTRGK
jgi:subtilisin family serine protease